jgi:RecG-like helicase
MTIEIINAPPPGMKPITEKLTVSTHREFILGAVRDAVGRGKRVAVVGDSRRAQIFTSGVRTCEEVTAEMSRTKTKGGLRL